MQEYMDIISKALLTNNIQCLAEAVFDAKEKGFGSAKFLKEAETKLHSMID
jgi:hypothetical protein